MKGGIKMNYDYAVVVKEFPEEILQATKKLKKDIRTPHKDVKTTLESFFNLIAKIIGADEPEVIYEPENALRYMLTGGGEYDKLHNKVYIYKKSFVTILHECRHYMQSQGRITERYLNDDEHDARAWSISLFNKIAPKEFSEAARKGLIANYRN